MFDPARFDPPQHDRPGRAPVRWRGGVLSTLLLGAVFGLAVAFILMPWFAYARAWYGATFVTWLGVWMLAGILVVPAWRAGRTLVAWLGWRRLAAAGSSLLLVLAAAQAFWLAFGWVPFRPICMGGTFYEIVGRMNPVAVTHVEDWLRRGWGPSAVTQDETGQLLVRPAIRSIGAEDLMNYIDKDGWRIAARHGIHWPPLSSPILHCEEVAAVFMEGPWELEQGWGYWPYNTIDPFSLLGRELMSLHR